MNGFLAWRLLNSSDMNAAIAFSKLNEDLQDCPTWILVEKQRKTPYPPPPTFFLHTVSQTSLSLVLQQVLYEPILRSACCIVQDKRAIRVVTFYYSFIILRKAKRVQLLPGAWSEKSFAEFIGSCWNCWTRALTIVVYLILWFAA